MNVMKGILIAIFLLFGPVFLKPKLIYSLEIWWFFGILSILLITHPKMNFEKLGADDHSPKDKKSLLFINVGAYLVILPVYFSFISGYEFPRNLPVYVYFGLVIGTCAVLFRWWSIRTLGAFFTAEVAIKDDHHIIDTGPYRYIRHPSYTGAILLWMVTPLIFDQLIFLPWTVAVLSFIYAYRIKVEESALKERFGSTYEAYMDRTYALIPFIF